MKLWKPDKTWPRTCICILHTTRHYSICVCVCVCVYYLVYFLPAILIHTADLCVIMQQQLTAVGVSSNHRAVVEGSQSPTVFIVRWCTQVQQRLVGEQGYRGDIMFTLLLTVPSLCCIYHQHAMWRSEWPAKRPVIYIYNTYVKVLLWAL